jgi:hypothetical protein
VTEVRGAAAVRILHLAVQVRGSIRAGVRRGILAEAGRVSGLAIANGATRVGAEALVRLTLRVGSARHEEVALAGIRPRIADEPLSAVCPVVAVAVLTDDRAANVANAGVDAIDVVRAGLAIGRQALVVDAHERRAAVRGSGRTAALSACAWRGAGSTRSTGSGPVVARTVDAADRAAHAGDTGVSAIGVGSAGFTIGKQGRADVVDAMVDAVGRSGAGFTVHELADLVDALSVVWARVGVVASRLLRNSATGATVRSTVLPTVHHDRAALPRRRAALPSRRTAFAARVAGAT